MTSPALRRYSTFHEQHVSLRVVKWALAPLIALHVALASFSGYRAIVQIFSVDLRVAERTMHPGSVVSFGYVSSARVWSDSELELIQGSVKRSLARDSLPPNVNPSYDPRPRSVHRSLRLTEESFQGFRRGPAILRMTAYGNRQWLRTPPPVVREIQVTIVAP
jgi:hypothetical protein